MKKTNFMNRRNFLRTTVLGTAAIGLPAYSWARVIGANDAIRVAVVGFGGRGQALIAAITSLQSQGVRITALCDVDQKVLKGRAAELDRQGIKVRTYRDIRQLLEDPAIDAVVCATPNHWHSLCTVWACQAGKDVYVEKPVSHNVWEGRKSVEAARKHGRIVQTGTQCRSSQAIREAVAWVREGHLGKIQIARGLCYKARPSIGRVAGPQPVPPEVDYDLWCGPAAKTPPRRKLFRYDWHWIWDLGNGDLGNQGVHQMDIARWFLGETALSPTVVSIGGRVGYADDGQTPNTQFVFHGYEKAPLLFEVRGLPGARRFQTENEWRGNMDEYLGASIGVVIHGEGGRLVVPSYFDAMAFDTEGNEIRNWSNAAERHPKLREVIRARPAATTGTLDRELVKRHFENFFKAMRSRKAGELTADIEEGHLSSALCHTGHISHLLGAKAGPDAIRASLRSRKPALETWERMVAHLKANDLDPATDSQMTLGPVLTMDPAREMFTGNEAANALLKRAYRAPFVVPDQV